MDLMDGIESDFINLIRRDYSDSMFERCAKIIMGDEWKTDGAEMLKDNAPEFLDRFNKYVDSITASATEKIESDRKVEKEKEWLDSHFDEEDDGDNEEATQED